jgi:FlaA1/EpsC-like NDP-sugar epimerase
MILVTGAAGSLGSEICKQLVRDGEKVAALDIDEYGLWLLAHEIDVKTICDSVTRPELWESLRKQSITHVINCAAVKHVFTVEQHEEWAHLVNYMSMRYMFHYGWKVVHISTDKAVIPINKYGMSKLNAERTVLSTGGVVVRLVNIHNSRGCAEEIFRQQIEAGGPVTARDERMERYFTTVEQAAADVITIANNATCGLYMPDPGKPVKMDDIIRELIREEYDYGDHIEDAALHVKIVYAGAGPEEKLIEDVLTPYEKCEPVAWSDRIYKVVRK